MRIGNESTPSPLIESQLPYPLQSLKTKTINGQSWDCSALINGNFEINQLGDITGTTSWTANGYNLDQWQTLISGSSCTTSQQAFTLGQTQVPGEPKNYIRHVVTSSAGAGNYTIMYQPIEDVRKFAGETVTFCGYGRADTTRNVGIELYQSFGSGGSPSSAVSCPFGLISLTSSWQFVVITGSVSSISGKILGTVNNHNISFWIWMDAGSTFSARSSGVGQQSGTFEFANLMLISGDQPIPYYKRDHGTEERLCQRYYEVQGGSASSPVMHGYGVSGSYIGQTVAYATPKRIVPTLSKVGTWNVSNCAQPSVQCATKYAYELYASVSGTGGANFLSSNSSTYVTIDARY